ncbi:MAG TPA: GntR family transcriptional regulator [Conexibacter sp.]|nr:GntR family transcriptional regulator [Conexibacter sp.]
MGTVGGEPLDIRLDRDGDVPLGVQLAWALRARIEGGTLAAGERLPGLQRLAQAVGVNANTVRAVYQRLEQDGLVATRHGSGTFVTGSGGERRALAQLAADAAHAARVAGVDPRAVAAALYVGGDVPAAPSGTVTERRRLRAQIAALEQALAELTARQAAPPAGARPRPSRTASAAGPRLPTTAELERTRDDLLQRLAAAQAARAPEDPPSWAPPRARRQANAPAPRLRPAPRGA